MGLTFGSYLKKPITEKESTDESNDKLVFGASSMQGWRSSQEDAHNCILDYDTDTAFFAVYDGHGGHEVAQYCSLNLPDFIKNTPEYKENKMEEALISGFLQFDATIVTDEVVEALKKMVYDKKKEKKVRDESDDEEEEEEENVNDLYEEAAMPIEQVIEKYTASLKEKVEDQGIKSPSVKEKKDSEEIVDTSSDSCSSSSTSQDQENCGDSVSSSSEATSTNRNNGESKVEVNGLECVSEGKPTMSNGTAEKNEVESILPEPNEQKAESPIQNGGVSTPNSQVPPTSDVTSSSSPVENGTPSKKGKGKTESVKTSTDTRPKINAEQLYKEFLNCEDDGEDSDEDPTFEAPDEDDSDGVNVSIDDASEGSSEEDDEDDEDDEKETAFYRNMSQKPGSYSGCTAVVALLKGNKLYVANAGDCRCILCRNGKAIDMSVDHKPEDSVETERIEKAGGEINCGRVNGGLNLSRAIGDHRYKQDKELSDQEQLIIALPDVKTLTINPNEDEFIVLACDGIWNSMSSQEVVDFVKPRMQEEREKLSTICEEMFDNCLSTSTFCDSAGCDNMTAIIVKFKSNGPSKRPVPPTCSEVNNTKMAKTEPHRETQVDTTV